AVPETTTGGGAGDAGAGAGGRGPTAKAPFIPSRAWPLTLQRKRNVPLRGNETVIVWLCPGRRRCVLLPWTTKSWTLPPRFRTTNPPAHPPGAPRRGVP